ncbi:DUF4214 domain-containing protein [Aquihabitans sp. McL0605]|uniref:DUF4214 domain-containing protein n=1 Tax=Aquihabitans sp. McL0605 TaxID=3415671 RepID=UPI003CF56B5D
MSHTRRVGFGVSVVAASLLLAFIPLATAASAAPPPVRANVTDAPICPAATPNGRFVRWIYLQILNRCPDASGASYWTAKLDKGTDRWAFARQIDYSDENIYKNNVDGLYSDLLGRTPTADEAAAGAASIRSTEGDANLIAHLASSDEFYATMQGATAADRDQAWLNFAYNGIVDRDPDVQGRAHYTAVLASPSTEATRHKVAMSLEHSAENAGGWTTAVYFAGLNRPPDPSGFAHWKNWLLTTGFRTFRMWTGILSSDEANRFAQTQPNPPAPAPATQTRAWGHM